MHDAISATRLDSAETAVLERRAWVRYPANLKSTCCPAEENGPERWSATICDLSAGGACLRVNRHFERGTLLRIELPNRSRRSLRILLARIVRVSETNEGEWSVGCAFTSPLSEAEVRGLVP